MSEKRYFTGIGSRETPQDILVIMTKISQWLTQKYDYTLYSGGAEGADSAFESGATNKIIFLPWDGFCDKYVVVGDGYIVPEYNENFIRKYHPSFDRLTKKGKLLMSRNTYQILGKDLSNKTDFVCCWTKNGKLQGGTAQAMRIAQDYGVPIFNLAIPNNLDVMANYIKTYLL